MSSLLDLVKQNNEDFEWYPTTNEMLEVLSKRIKQIEEDKNLNVESMLDIGAGDGRVLKYFNNDLRINKIHAIEKSRTLIDSMDKDILIIGSDFHQTSLIEKTYDLVFCNPPYSNYKEWVMRILRETNNADLLQCMNVNKKKLIKGIKSKIKDLKYLYWKELFSKLDAIRNRVTSTYAGYLHESVIVENNVDFNKDNIYSVVLWVIKNADKYIKKSYLSFFDKMARGENVLCYKSNQRFNIDYWRFANREDKNCTPNPYKLDYRIVLPRIAYLSYGSYYHDDDWTNFLRDLRVIARNLGFYTENITFTRFQAGKSYKEWSGDKVLFEVKHYKNGNAHIKFNMEFMEKLNIQVGRINNWIKNKAEAREEFKNISNEDLDSLFEKSIGISVGDSVKMLEMF
ncbi:DUF4942 domain-containing protein [Helicobacter typhlonius]|uniref:class I SAM-dependent methyltransferase n=1 Tax=Helicobacter typhlonius TaxID=76936 RepID=UPI002FE422C5